MYQFSPQSPEDISARALVLSLLATVNSEARPIAQLAEAGKLFGIEPSALRVAMTRMAKAGLVESVERGVYTAGPKARALSRRAREWQNVEERTVAWDGGWWAALTHHLGRTDRKQLRARERALALSGYRETGEQVWVRPANLAAPIEAHRDALIEIGADAEIRLLEVTAFSPGDAAWRSLWSAQSLAANYGEAMHAMAASLSRLPDLATADAARETLLIGQAVIRLINFDPLLPPELGDQKRFHEMVRDMKRYNTAGQACWARYFRETAGEA